MKKAFIGSGMLALACLVCGPAFAVDGVPHAALDATTSCVNYTGMAGNPPVPTFGALMPSTDPEIPSYLPYGAPNGGSLPKFSLGSGTNYDTTVTFPAIGAYDFCAAFDTASCSLGAVSMIKGITEYMGLFLCGTDINGKVNLDPPDGQLPVSPNGIPDGEYELGLLAAILNDSYALDPAKTGGKTNADIRTQFQANFQTFKKLVLQAISDIPVKLDGRTLVPSLAPYLVPSLVTILAGFATEGDGNTLDALDAVLGMLDQLGMTPPPGGVRAITTGFTSILSPEGDADGDGATNREEYNYYKNKGGAAKVIEAQLTLGIKPPPVVPGCAIVGGGGLTVDEQITLTAAPVNTSAMAYEWFKNGVSLGITSSSLIIPQAALTDSGTYTCVITIDGTGKTVTSDPAFVSVVPKGELPIAGGLGLALLAGACALGGVGSIRRRK